MHITLKDAWTILHGMTFGALFLIAFAGGVEALLALRPGLLTSEGIIGKVKRLSIGTWTMAAVAWAAVITGTWIPYVWYRDKAPTSPKSILIASELTAKWHEFGMEWKEHVAWLAPMFATVVAYLVYYYGKRLVKEEKIRQIAMTMFTIAFVAAAVAGMFGALINKAAPTR